MQNLNWGLKDKDGPREKKVKEWKQFRNSQRKKREIQVEVKIKTFKKREDRQTKREERLRERRFLLPLRCVSSKRES